MSSSFSSLKNTSAIFVYILTAVPKGAILGKAATLNLE